MNLTVIGIVLPVVCSALDPLSHLGSLTSGLRSPARIAIAADGTVYVTDTFYRHISRYDSAGTLLGTWDVPEGPVGIAVHPDGRLFISLRDVPKVAVYDAAFTRTGFLGDGQPQVAFVRPTDIDVADDAGRIYVVDSGGDRVYGFEATGAVALILGARGERAAEFLSPSAVSVDETNARLLVADHDNFRVQVFTTDGLFLTRFGHLNKYTVGGGQEGWMPRTQGLEVDAIGRIYVADSMMGTVRLFDTLGTELAKVAHYGFDAGNVRTPCDVALSPDGTRLYVVSTNTSTVEIFATPALSGVAGSAGLDGDPTTRGSNASPLDSMYQGLLHHMPQPVGAALQGPFPSKRRTGLRTGAGGGTYPLGVDTRGTDFERNVMSIFLAERTGDGSPGAFGAIDGSTAASSAFEPPHVITATISCGRCHGINAQPGIHVGLLEGQSVLCMSCHSAGGQALSLAIHERDVADPFGTNPTATDGRGRSHAWGVPAVNALADSVGPRVGGSMSPYLDNGRIKCSTCHDQHSNEAGTPYLRTANDADQMCKECHAPRNVGPGGRGTHPVGFTYPGGTGEFPAVADVAPLQLRSGRVECMTCHAVHDADSGAANGGEGDGTLLRTANDETLCETCHADHRGHSVRGVWSPTCRDCHDVHDPANANLALVSRMVRNQSLGVDQPVVFTARSGPNSFDDGDPTANDGICQVCHTATTYHQHNGLGAAHNDGVACTTCHTHSNGFLPTGGSSCIGCHSGPQDNGDGLPLGGRPKIVNADGTGGHHMVGAALTDADCVTCHEMTRHRQGTVRLWADPNDPTTPLTVTGNPANLVAFCRNCHDAQTHPTTHNVPGPWQPVCTECHEVHDPANTNLALVHDVVRSQTLAQNKSVVFTARTGPNSFDDGDPTARDGVCQVCHTATRYHLNDGTGVPHNDGADCTSCHSHSDGFIPTGGSSCVGCHSSPQDNGDGIPIGGRPRIVNADGTGGHHLAGAALIDADCVVCHEMSEHQRGTVRLWTDPNAPVTPLPVTGNPADLVAFCKTCHDAQTHPATHTVPGPWQPVCTECHELHDPANANLALVRDVVRNQTLAQNKLVVFTARTGPNSFDDGDPTTNDGVCQVCHTATVYHLNDGAGVPHNDGTDCTSCHSHPDGFIPVGGTSCIGCHDTARGQRRPVVAEFGRASHHVVGGGVTDADCIVCHDMSGHQQGTVRLKDVDDPTNPLAVVTLTGDPGVSPVEAAKLGPFCLACHDGDAAAGNAPFSDGIMPPAIDAVAWSGGAHSVGSVTCFGDGNTFGCHGTGHGSIKRKLLAPATGGQTPVAGDPLREEEGQCYSCHDAGGPALTDVQSLFARASHHKVSATEQVDGARIECTSCHNPHTASTSAPLIDPDTGAAWTAGGAGFCLACHDGTPPAGVAFPPTSLGTGFNKSAFAGTAHATRLGGNTCRHCHEDHGSTYSALLRAEYIVADNNSYAAADYAVCWQCHSASSIVNGSNKFANLHNKHVNGERSPCIICHDVHAPFDTGEPGLVNFSFAAGNSGYDFQFISGRNASTAFYLTNNNTSGNCLLSCHGKQHLPQNYSRGPSPSVTCTLCHAS